MLPCRVVSNLAVLPRFAARNVKGTSSSRHFRVAGGFSAILFYRIIRHYMDITVNVIDRQGEKHVLEAPTDMNMNLMEVCKAYELPVEGTCGGMALCASCHCYVESEHPLPEPSDDEEDMLDQAFFVEDNSRLGCQIRITEAIDGLTVKLAPQAED